MLVILIRGCFLHARDEGVDDTLILALEEFNRGIDVFRILLATDEVHARSRTALDLILQARSRAIAEKTVLAIANHEQFLQVVQCLSHSTRTGIGPEVPSPALAWPAVKLQERKLAIR